MELVNSLMQFVPLGILAAVFGATYMLGKMLGNPKWLIAVPFGLGLILGSMNYFTLLDPAAIAAKPWWLNLIAAVLMGAGYGGAEVLLWEKVAKRTFNSNDTNNP